MRCGNAVGYALVENPDPEHRAALIKVLPRLTNVTVRAGTDSLGRPATIISRTETLGAFRETQTLLLDPASGRTLEQRDERNSESDPGTMRVSWSVTVEERLVDGPPPWVPLPGMTCKRAETDPATEGYECR